MRYVTTAGVIALALGLSACGAGGNDSAAANGSPFGDCIITGEAGSSPLNLISDGVVTVKADLPSPGWYNGDTVESIKSGFDYCLLANIAHRGGAKGLNLQNSSFDGLVAGKAGSFDMALNQITITPERESVMDFSDPYYESTAGVLVKKGSTLTQSDLADSHLGVKQGTVGQMLVDKTIKPAKAPAVFPGDAEQQAAVAAGRIDAGIQDLSIVLGASVQSGGKLTVVGQIPTHESYGVMMPKGSANVVAVNKMLKEMKDDGTLDKLNSTYLTEAYGVDPTTIPVWSF
ncbi:ABC transporter substrate-binding protein [Arthrobacter polaris]|uniref:ABC transporter substrate-binding protein n=1 Tax=Arthrobacter polaris TaxID=2813727 RepID=UPI001F3F9D48|nr:ABC transporter substrate-binding protein [Arthrobacter polaris]UIK88459.1 amino acid ABC transporter substrate-binding protein [Arthrobacter polaris]